MKIGKLLVQTSLAARPGLIRFNKMSPRVVGTGLWSVLYKQ